MKRIFFVIYFLNFANCFSQDSNPLNQKFWESYYSSNDSLVIYFGEKLIDKEQLQGFDTVNAIIRIITAHSYSNINEFDHALKLNHETLELCKKKWKVNNRFSALSIYEIALNHHYKSEYKTAEKYYLEAYEIFSKLNDTVLSNLAMCSGNLGNLYVALNNFDDADYYLNKSLEIYRKTTGVKSPDYANALISLGELYQSIERYDLAEKHYIESLKIFTSCKGEKSFEVAYTSRNLGDMYRIFGNYSLAEPLIKKSVDLTRQLLGSKDIEYGQSLRILGALYLDLGDFELSIKYYMNAADIFKSFYGESNPDFCRLMNEIGVLFYRLKNYQIAERYFSFALNGFIAYYGLNDANVAMTLNNLSNIYFDQCNYEKALTFSQKALDISAKSLGNYHTDVAAYSNNLANIFFIQGNLEMATKYFEQAIDIYNKQYGKNSPKSGLILGNLGTIYFCKGDTVKSIGFFSEALRILESSFKKNRVGLSSKQLLFYKKDLELSFYNLTNANNLNKDISIQIYRSWLNFNGLLSSDLEITNIQSKTLPNSPQNKLLSELIQVKHQLYNLYDSPVSYLDSINILINQTYERISSIEVELSLLSKSFQNITREISNTDVSNHLSAGDILIDIVSIPSFYCGNDLKNTTSKYWVFFSDSKDTIVDYLILENGNSFEKELLQEYNNQTSINKTENYFNNEYLYTSFWKPIADKIGDAKTFYVSLGGVYNNINLNTLFNPETGKYLIEEKDIRIVNSARDFVLSKEQEKIQYSTMTSALYGFPDFNGVNSPFDSVGLFASTRDLNYILIDTLTRGGMKASPLPATKIEIEQIATTFQKNGWTVNTFTSDKASETNIKREVSPRVLHVATHGYFFEDIPLDTTENRFLGMDRNRVVEDPMLRSGLLFTGANKTLQGEESKGENGLLSAAEASLLDLRETELVVLSACETGKGEVKNSEGVYGLRKAFADAGAKNIIMSLWKVDDKVTQEFMTRFYEIWLNDKTTIREAFNRTQLEIKEKYPQPYYWGAFILVGE